MDPAIKMDRCPMTINIDRFILQDPSKHLQKLGEGSFANVYLYRHKELNYEVAIKEIKIPVDETTRESSNEIHNEIETHKTLKHVNIVRYIVSAILFNKIFIFIEYVEGGSLRKYLSQTQSSKVPPRSGLNVATILKYSEQILEGLAYLHNSRIIHRDLRSANVLRSTDNLLKIADFGISKKLNTLSEKSEFSTTEIGNIYWRAPEMFLSADGTGVGRKVDVWSFGIVMLEMIHVSPPFMKKWEPIQYMFQLANNKNIPSIPAYLPREIIFLIAQCLTFDWTSRVTSEQVLGMVKMASLTLSNQLKVLSGQLTVSIPPALAKLNGIKTKVVWKEILLITDVFEFRKNPEVDEFTYAEIVMGWVSHHKPESVAAVLLLFNEISQKKLCWEYMCDIRRHLVSTLKYPDFPDVDELPEYHCTWTQWLIPDENRDLLKDGMKVRLTWVCTIKNCEHAYQSNKNVIDVRISADTDGFTVVELSEVTQLDFSAEHGHPRDIYKHVYFSGCTAETTEIEFCSLFTVSYVDVMEFIQRKRVVYLGCCCVTQTVATEDLMQRRVGDIELTN